MNKLFVVTKKEYGYSWNKVVWVRYFLAVSKEIVKTIVEKRYGPMKHYYRYDEVETITTIDEVEFEDLSHAKEELEQEEY